MLTNFVMVKELNKAFAPKRAGVSSADEVALIRKSLCIKEMDNLQLQNLRDFVVMFYNAIDATREDMDKMSAIVGVIDNEKFSRGMEV